LSLTSTIFLLIDWLISRWSWGSGAESIGEWIRLMRELGLHRVMPRKFRVKTHSDHKHPIAKNVLDRNLKALRAEPEMDCRYHVHLLGERGLAVSLDTDGPLLAPHRPLADGPQHRMQHESPRQLLSINAVAESFFGPKRCDYASIGI